MPQLARTDSAADRALALRMRADLELRPQRFGGQRYWAVKDPVSLKYFHLRHEEYTILTMLDGRTSLDEVRRRCQQAFAPRPFGNVQLQGFLAALHRYGLLVAESPGQGAQLLARHNEARRQRRLETLASALAIRFRGVSPRGLLDWLYPKVRGLFSPLAVAAAVVLALAAGMLVLVEFDAFRGRLPSVHAFTSASNLPWLLVALAGTKILHELGHALACRHFGGDCHEIGLMLLVFTPCLYCNVSDSWMLDSKWRRIVIAAAGIYVELVLASVCVFLWWFSQPGLFNALCLNTIVVCSVGTLVFNGNPLLRYDGYFILSDLVEAPNLRARSVAAVQRIAGRWCLGLDVGDELPSTPRSTALLVLYAAASTVYRWVVVVAILWGVDQALRQYRLEPLIVPVVALALVGMLWPLAAGATRLARSAAGRRPIARARAAVAGAVVASLGLLLALVPVPMRVMAPVVVEYRDAARVYVSVPGTLANAVRTGAQVHKGDSLARLDNPGVLLEVAKVTSERDSQQVYLKNLESQRLEGAIDGAQIPAAKAALADANERLAQLERDAQRLTLVAPVDGTVLPPPAVARRETVGDKLEPWHGMPLDERNEHAYLDRGTLVCLVGDPTRFEAALHVEQTDVDLVDAGQRVRMMFDSLPGEIFEGTVVEIVKVDLKVMPRELEAAGDLPARTDERGVTRPLDTWYQARVAFDRDPPHLVARVHGTAKIAVAPRSLGWQLARYLKQTFSGSVPSGKVAARR